MSLFPVCRAPRYLALAAVTGLLGCMLAVATASTHWTGAATATTATTHPLRIGSYNIQLRRSIDQFKAGVSFLKTQVDVAGLQEAGGGQRRPYLDGDRSWRIYHPPGLIQDPVIWNPDVFELVSAHQVKLSRGMKIEGSGSGLIWLKANYAPVVRLRQISTGYVFTVINVHLRQDAVNSGRKVPGRPRTFRAYVRQVKALRALVHREKHRGHPVYVVGDFNVGYAADKKVHSHKLPYHRLRSVNLVSNWKGKKLNDYGTHIDSKCPRGKAHCGAYIDQIWAPSAAATSRVFIHQVHSDHYPIMSTYPIPVPAGYSPKTGSAGFATTQVSEREWNKPWQTRDNPMRFPLTGDLAHGSVDFQVTEGTAVEGQDFTVDTSEFSDGDPTTNDVIVHSVPNFTREHDKTFTLTLVNPVDTTITSATASGIITNDD